MPDDETLFEPKFRTACLNIAEADMRARYVFGRMLVAMLLGVAMYLVLMVFLFLAFMQHVFLPLGRDRGPADLLGIRMGKALSQWLFEASRFLCLATMKNRCPGSHGRLATEGVTSECSCRDSRSLKFRCSRATIVSPCCFKRVSRSWSRSKSQMPRHMRDRQWVLAHFLCARAARTGRAPN
jgi:hypothetical protein